MRDRKSEIQADHITQTIRVDFILSNEKKDSMTSRSIFAVPADIRLKMKEREKITITKILPEI